MNIEQFNEMLLDSARVGLAIVRPEDLHIVFHQHKLERLEALEEDELAQARESGGGAAGSIFDSAGPELLKPLPRSLSNGPRIHQS